MSISVHKALKNLSSGIMALALEFQEGVCF